jgi:protein tyrosine phosphatase (PTP) superfamily phosphohydrolase (DUF442 family)
MELRMGSVSSSFREHVSLHLARCLLIRVIVVASTIGASALMGLGVFLGLRTSGNFGVIEQGLAYRSGQLRPGEIDAIVREDGIRSIISLVPPEPDDPWYLDEIAVSAAQHLARYEIPLSAVSEVTSAELCRPASLLQNAPKPILIHSKHGADRAGLAAAIFEYAVAARSADEARAQLSVRYGHSPYLFTGTGAMDSSFHKFLLEQRSCGVADNIEDAISKEQCIVSNVCVVCPGSKSC